MNKTFYEVLWALCYQNNQVQDWIDSGLLIRNQLTYSWTPKALEQLGFSNSIGERKAPEHDPINGTASKVKEKLADAKVALTIEPNFLSTFINKFNKQNIGLSGKTTDKNTVLKKLIKFFKEYPDYSTNDVLEATDLYINDLRSKGSLMYIRECGYFISKKVDGVDQSDLAKWCEEKKNGGTSYTNHRIL